MRKKMFFLALSLAAIAGVFPASHAVADSGGSCPICTTYADGSRCCVSCWCDGSGQIVACTQNYCPPPDGGDGGGD